jgi:hypothetical protein
MDLNHCVGYIILFAHTRYSAHFDKEFHLGFLELVFTKVNPIAVLLDLQNRYAPSRLPIGFVA